LLKIFSPKTVWIYVKHFARGRRYERGKRLETAWRGFYPGGGRYRAVWTPGSDARRSANGRQL